MSVVAKLSPISATNEHLFVEFWLRVGVVIGLGEVQFEARRAKWRVGVRFFWRGQPATPHQPEGLWINMSVNIRLHNQVPSQLTWRLAPGGSLLYFFRGKYMDIRIGFLSLGGHKNSVYHRVWYRNFMKCSVFRELQSAGYHAVLIG